MSCFPHGEAGDDTKEGDMLGKADGRKARALRKLLLLTAAAVGVYGVSGCGGGGSNNGGGGGAKVTVTPAAVAVVLNGTQRFSATVTGVTGIPIAATNGAVRAGNVVTITTTQAHTLLIGQVVTVAGVTDASFNGTFLVASVPSPTTFTYAQTGADATSGGGTASNGSVNWFVNDVAGGNPAVGTIDSDGLYTAPSALPPPVTATITSSGAVRASNVVTITTTAAHDFFAGQTVIISGVTDASFNGTFVISSAPSTTTFTYSQTAANATSGGGTASSFSVKIKAASVAVSTATGTAVAVLNSGITVSILPSVATVGTDESFTFTASVANDSLNQGVNWSVKEANAGTIDANGRYTAPATVPTPATATIQAVSKADPSKSATATVTIVTAVPPTFTAITPTTAPQGGLFQDVYLIAGNLRSTSVVNFNGVRVLASQLKIISSSLARIRLTDAQLAVANTSPGFPIEVVGVATPQFLKVTPVRPALLQSIPDSAQQNGVATSIVMDGGYFGPPGSPVVTATFNGSTRAASLSSARRLSMTLNAGDQGAPGLYPVSVQNAGAPEPVAVSNFAVQPDPAANGPSLVTTIPMGAGSAPSAIAADSVLGVAIVALQGANSVQRIDLKLPTPALLGSPITVGTAPTGVAVDHIRHIAAVVNSTGKSVSVVDLAPGTVLGTIDLSTVTTASPFSVGIDPHSGLGLVAYQSTNSASIINLDAGATPTCLIGTAPYCVVGTVTANTGAAPQVAIEPKLRWAFVTPGGAGLLSIVDLGRQTVSAIQAAPGGARRASNAVTIKTTAEHGIDPANPGSVLIAGVADPSFNGTFTVTGVPDAITFTYSQTGPDATSGAGQVNYARPLITFTLGTNVRGISINPETERALLTDPNAGLSQVFFLSTLDQTNTSLSLNGTTPELGATASAYQPFSNTGVVVNSLRNELSVLCPVNCNSANPSQPLRLTVLSTGGTGSGAVVVDPPANQALVANNTSNDVSVISLGSIKSVHVSEVLIPAARQLIPGATFTSGTDLPVTIFGVGLSGGQVRLDGVSIGSGSVSSGGRQLDITIPASFLAAPRRFALDVVNGGTNSNALGFTVAQSVDLSSAGANVCGGATSPLPGAVAIDAERGTALVTNAGCNNVSLLNLNTGAVTQTIAVGSTPAGVALDSRLGLAVVANTGDAAAPGSTVSIVDVDPASGTFGTVKSTVNVGTQPLGVAIDPDSGKAVVTNVGSNTVSMIDLTATSPTAATGAVNQRPVAVAIDPDRRIAVVVNAFSGVINILDIAGATPVNKSSISTSSLPTGVAFDAATGLFFVTSSLSNTIFALNPDTLQITAIRVGVNPTSLAYNFQSGTLVTINTASNTISLVDSQTFTTRATLGIGASPQFAVAIHPRANLAVVANQANNRVLFLPLR